MLTADRLRELLDYSPETGVFVWRQETRPRRPLKGTVAGGSCGSGYGQIQIDGRTYRNHRLAWLWVHGAWPDGWLDHVNLDRHDNRISNLRLVTASNNSGNSGKRQKNRSGFKGVSWSDGNHGWRAVIHQKGKQFNLGTYATAEEAHAAYLAKARELFGEFARG